MFAQSQTGGTLEIKGRVVEIANGQTKGVPNVQVRIPGFHYDITDKDGYFTITCPAKKEYVTVVVEGSSNKMIKPPSGVVEVPPTRDLEIILCGEENKKLMQKVNKLNGDIEKLKKENELTKRQLLEMHELLLDTILHLENDIARMEQQTKETKEEFDAQLKAKDARIEALVQALSEALEERFLKQKEYFDLISSELMEYTDRLKDLRDRCLPQDLSRCFSNTAASAELNRTIKAYNEARDLVLAHFKGHVLAVRQYWDNPATADDLEAMYNYLLNDVHKKGVYPLNERVFEQVRKCSDKGGVGCGKAEKEATKAAEEILLGLNTSILELERKIQSAINTMTTTI
jgi:hypothetical protein